MYHPCKLEAENIHFVSIHHCKMEEQETSICQHLLFGVDQLVIPHTQYHGQNRLYMMKGDVELDKLLFF